jgi:nucleoside-diphosphate-sugar epimerase
MNSTKQPRGPGGSEISDVPPSRALILGCGFLGRALAASLRSVGTEVYGTCRRAAAVAELEAMGIRPLRFDADDAASVSSLDNLPVVKPLDVYCLLPPGAAADRDGDAARLRSQGMRALYRRLSDFPIRRAVLSSSTSVYGDRDGGSVDADTPPMPGNARAQWLLEIERLWLKSGLPARVVRLAGLYGPGRVIGMRPLRQGDAIGGDPRALLNLIHVEDAAALLMAVAAVGSAGSVELGADGRPIPRQEYYEHLARRLGTKVTWSESGTGYGAGRARATRACDIRLTCARTGWHPRYGDYRAVLEALIPLPVDPAEDVGN